MMRKSCNTFKLKSKGLAHLTRDFIIKNLCSTPFIDQSDSSAASFEGALGTNLMISSQELVTEPVKM